jgi:hypothetical protein
MSRKLAAGPEAAAAEKDRFALLAWSAVALGVVLQYALFRAHALREVVWSYPAAHDQCYFLAISYDTYEHIVNDGLTAGLRHGMTLDPLPPSGALLHLQAAVLYLFLGPGRLSALTLTFLYFAIFQGVLFGTMRKLSGRWTTAFLAWGLLLTCVSPFFWAGGLMDFRLDFPAACMFGVLICLALGSGLFASRRWSIVVGLVAAWLILLRFLTLVYLGGVIGLFAGYLARRTWRQRDVAVGGQDRRRLANLGIAVLIAAVLAVPGLWWHRAAISMYYIECHFTGKEAAIRMLMDGHGWTFYPRSLAMDHAGRAFLKLALLSLLGAGLLAAGSSGKGRPAGLWLIGLITAGGVAAVLLVVNPRWSWWSLWCCLGVAAACTLAVGLWRGRGQPGNRFLPGAPAAIFLLLLIGIPLAALTIDRHRSSVVGNVLVGPLVCLVLLPGLLWAPRKVENRHSLQFAGRFALAAVAVVSGAFVQLSHYSQHWMMTRRRADAERVLAMHDAIARNVLANGIRHPIQALTSTSDLFACQTSEALLYERHGTYRHFRLETMYFDDFSLEQACAAFDNSDFIILSRPEAQISPFDRSMTELLPKLRAYCEERFVRLGTYQLFGREAHLYARDIRLEGNTGDGLPAEGFTLAAPARALSRRLIELCGSLDTPLTSLPQVHASRIDAGRSSSALPATLEVGGKDYCLRIDCRDIDPESIETAEIRISFDPPGAAAGAANHTVVLPTPQRIHLIR